MRERQAEPYVEGGARGRWHSWEKLPLGSSGAHLVSAGMTDWSGPVPGALETVIHVLAPGSRPVCASRDIGDGRRTTLERAGQVCVTPAQRAGHWSWRGRFRDYNLVLPRSLLAHAAADAGLADLPDFMPLARSPLEEGLIERLVQHLASQNDSDHPACDAEIDHAVAFIAFWLLRQSAPSVRTPRGGLSPTVLRRVTSHIDERLSREIGVAELATLAGLSMPHFSQAFRTSTGEPPYQYILRRRCAQACELLGGPDTISDIALATGFTSQSHFTTAFRKVYGVTPAAWRRSRG